jgi:hypothetical protein
VHRATVQAETHPAAKVLLKCVADTKSSDEVAVGALIKAVQLLDDPELVPVLEVAVEELSRSQDADRRRLAEVVGHYVMGTWETGARSHPLLDVRALLLANPPDESPQTREVLLTALERDPIAEARRAAVLGLPASSDPALLRRIADRVARETYPLVRLQCMHYLAQAPASDRAAIDALKGVAFGSYSDKERAVALSALHLHPELLSPEERKQVEVAFRDEQ